MPTIPNPGHLDDALDEISDRSAAIEFLDRCGLTPNPDAVDQLTYVFLPCLRIICERPWSKKKPLWRKAGLMGVLTDVRRKFERYWERAWVRRERDDDSGFDLINFVGFSIRSEDGWSEWGEPGSKS